MFRLVVLADLHYGSDHFFSQPGGDPGGETLADSVSNVLPRPIDGVIFAGDFLSTNQSSDVQLAEGEVDRLLAAVGPQHAIAVPGNHDVTWVPALRQDRLYFYNRLVGNVRDLQAPANALPMIVEAPSGGRRGIAFILIDSCRLENEIMGGLGRVTSAQLQDVERMVAERGIAPESHILVAVLHHHLLPVAMVDLPRDADPQEGPYPRVSITVDAVEVLRRLAALGVELVIHGHQHRRAIIEFRNRAWRDADHALHVIAAGSCGASTSRRQFFLIEVDDNETIVTSYAQHPDNEAIFAPDVELPAVILPIGLD